MRQYVVSRTEPKALNIESILREVILSFNGSICRDERCYVYSHNERRYASCAIYHQKLLFQILTVSKLWASVVTPVLWENFATNRSLFCVWNFGMNLDAPIPNRSPQESFNRLYHYTKYVKTLHLDLTREEMGMLQITRLELYTLQKSEGEKHLLQKEFQLVFQGILSQAKEVSFTQPFPNLRRLVIKGFPFHEPLGAEGPPALSFLLSPRTREIIFTASSKYRTTPPSSLVDYFIVMKEHAPRLEHLCFADKSYERRPSSLFEGELSEKQKMSVLQTIADMQHLRSLNVPTEWGFLGSHSLLSRSLSLQKLYEGASLSSWEPSFRNELNENSTPPQNEGFPSLTSLHLDGFIDDFSASFESFPLNHQLETLSATREFALIPPILKSASRTFPRLTSLHLEQRYAIAERFEIGKNLFVDLKKFRELRKLRIVNVKCILIGDIQEALVQMPNLEDLTLTGYSRGILLNRDFEDEDEVTAFLESEITGLLLRDLGTIASCTPKLKHLEISLHASHIPEGIEHSFGSLESLKLTSSFTNFRYEGCDYFSVAVYINSLVPPSVRFGCDDDGSTDEFDIEGSSYSDYIERLDLLVKGFLWDRMRDVFRREGDCGLCGNCGSK